MGGEFSFGKNFATCAGSCGQLRRNEELEDGKCDRCLVKEEQQRQLILSNADGNTLAKFVRQLTTEIKSSNKNEPISPSILDSALSKLGAHFGKDGKEALGELIGEQLLKSTGKGLTPAESAMWKFSPLVTHRWAELITRLATRIDDRQQLDVSSLSEEDLLASLTTLVFDMIRTNAEYRRMAVLEAIRVQPDLIHEAMTVAGMPAVEGEKIAPTSLPDLDDDDDFNGEAVEDDD